MREATPVGTWLHVIVLGVVALVIGCRQTPPAPATAIRVAEIAAVNPTRGFVDSIALAPDAARAATGERSGAIRVWTLSDPTDPVSLGEYRQAIIDLAFAPTGDALASLGRHGEGALRLWQPEARAGSTAWTEAAIWPMGCCLALRFDRSGGRLAVMCENEVLLIDLATRLETARVSNPHREVLTAFDLAADGAKLVTAGHEGDVTVWDTVTPAATPIRRFSVSRSRRPGPLPAGHEPPEVWAVVVALTPDGARAAAVTIEGTVYVWELATGAELLVDADAEAGGPPVGSLRFLDESRLLAATGDRHGMRLFDLARKTSEILAEGPKAYHTVAITGDARAFAALTSLIEGAQLTYGVEVWKIELPP